MRCEAKPNDKWSLDQLGKYCRTKTDRMAVDAWLAGKAMALAKEKTVHGRFSDWKRKWGYSDATVSRYIRLYKSHKAPESLRGKEIMEALRAADIVLPRAVAPPPVQVPTSKKDGVAKTAAKKSSPRPAKVSLSLSTRYPWVVEDEQTDLSEFDDAGESELVEATSETVLRMEIEALPEAFARLTRHLDTISGEKKEVLLRVWPKEYSAQVRAGAAELQTALKKISKLIPG